MPAFDPPLWHDVLIMRLFLRWRRLLFANTRHASTSTKLFKSNEWKLTKSTIKSMRSAIVRKDDTSSQHPTQSLKRRESEITNEDRKITRRTGSFDVRTTIGRRPKIQTPPTRRSLEGTLTTKPKDSRNDVNPRQFKVTRSALNIPIIHETSDLVCINKPPAILSQPGLPGEGTILELVQFQRPDLKVQTVNRFIYSSLRWLSLDKNTSGAMVLGRTESAIRELNLLFKQNKIEKNVH